MKVNKLRIVALCGALILFASLVGTQTAHMQTIQDGSDAASKEEQELLDEINLARTNPVEYAGFIETYFKDRQTKDGAGNVADLVRILKSTEPLPPLRLADGLRLAAKDLVTTQGGSGEVGHDIKDTEARIRRYGTPSGTLGENISYGSLTPRERIMMALLDDGIPSRVHRYNILLKEYKEVGIACGPNKQTDAMCVTTMARDFKPNGVNFPSGARLGMDNDNITVVSSVYNDNQRLPTPANPSAPPANEGTRVVVIPKASLVGQTPTPTPASPTATPCGCEWLERCCGQTQAKSKSPEPADLTTRLLFPFVTNQGGFDTGISIANTTADPFGTKPQSGICTLNFYGNTSGGGAAPVTQKSTTVIAGSTLVLSLSSGGTNDLKGASGFQGYIIAECNFPLAHGYYFISDIGAQKLATGGLAIILPSNRTASLPESLGH